MEFLNFTPKVIYTLDELRMAIERVHQLRAIPRSELCNEHRDQAQVLDVLIEHYFEHKFVTPHLRLMDHDVPPDGVVLELLMLYKWYHTAKPVTVEHLSEICGIPKVNLEQVLTGQRNLDRHEINYLCVFFKFSPSVFDFNHRCGIDTRKDRFRVAADSSIFDTTTNEHVVLKRGPGVNIVDATGSIFTLHPGCIGFAWRFQERLNIDHAATLKTYFNKEPTSASQPAVPDRGK